MEGVNLGSVFASIRLDSSGLTAGIEASKRAMQQMGQQMVFATSKNTEAMRSNLNTIGNYAAAASASYVLAMGFAVRESARFEQAMRNVNSISHMSENQFAMISAAVQRMAADIGKAPEDLANGLYDIASSGFYGRDGLMVLEASAKAARAGLATTAEAAKAITVALNAYGMQAAEASRVSDILFRGVDKGVFTFSELASSLGTAVASAAAAKVPIEDVVAAFATITKGGFSPDETATSINRLITSFLNPSKDLAASIKQAGYESGAALLQVKGLAGAVQFLEQASGGKADFLAQLGMDARALRAGLVLTKDGMRAFIADQGSMNDATGATNQAIEEQSKSLAVAQEKMSAMWKTVSIQLSESMIPAMKAATEWGTRFGKTLTDMSPGSKAAVVTIGAATAALTGLVAIVSKAAGMILAFQANMALSGTSIATLAASIGPWVAAVVAAAAAVWVVIKAVQYLSRTQADETKEALKSAMTKRDESAQVVKLVGEHDKLAGKKKLTADESERLRKVDDQLVKLAPNLISGYDDQKKQLELVAGAAKMAARNLEIMTEKAIRAASANTAALASPIQDQLVTTRDEILMRRKFQTQKYVEYESPTSGKHIRYSDNAELKRNDIALKAAEDRYVQLRQRLRAVMDAGHQAMRAAGYQIPGKDPKTGDGDGNNNGGGDNRPDRTPAAPTSTTKKTPAEKADEAARSALEFFEHEIAFGQATSADKAAGIERILAGAGQQGTPYTGLSRGMQTQLRTDLNSIRQEQERAAKGQADSLARINKEAAEADAAAIQEAQDYKIRTLEATGQKMAAIDARYNEEVRRLAEKGANSPEAVAALTAEWSKARDEARKEDEANEQAAADRSKQREMRLLEWLHDRGNLSHAEYAQILEKRQESEERFSDAWFEIQGKKENAWAEEAQTSIDLAEQMAEDNHDAAVKMLQDMLITYSAMGDAGVEACKRIEDALGEMTGKKKPGEAELTEWQKAVKKAWEDTLASIQQNTTDALVGMIEGTANFAETFKSIMHEMLRFVINLWVESVFKQSALMQNLGENIMKGFSAITTSVTKDIAKLTTQAMGLSSLFGSSGRRRTGGILGGLIGGFLAPAFTLGSFLTGAGIGAALLGGGFDNPINDTMAVRSGADYARLFRAGALSEMGTTGAAAPQPAPVVNNTSTENHVHITMQVDKVTGEPQDLERIADGLAWMINSKLRVAPAG